MSVSDLLSMTMRVRPISLLAVTVAMSLVPQSRSEPDDGLIAYWRFENNLRDSVSSYHGKSGLGGVGFTENGKFGSCLVLDGVDQFVEIGGSSGSMFNPKESFSVSLWCRALTYKNPYAEIISKGHSQSWRIGRLADINTISGKVGSRSLTLEEVNVFDDFRHLVMTFDEISGKALLFLDGAMLASGNVDYAVPSLEPLRIGGDEKGSDKRGGLWHGLIDDVALWTRALSLSEVRTIWNEGRGGEIADLMRDDDLDGMWDLWEEGFRLDAKTDDSGTDVDVDGLTNLQEFERRSNPFVGDTDGDGILDIAETNTGDWQGRSNRGTDPKLVDSDGDGLLDRNEDPSEGGTNPNLDDTDGDGFLDGDEIEWPSDPLEPTSAPPLAFGLEAYWAFDGRLDAYPQGVLDIMVPFPEAEINFVPGKLGDAIRLSGDQYLEVIDADNRFGFQGAKGFSIGCWLAPDSRGNDFLSHGSSHPWTAGLSNDGEPFLIPSTVKNSYSEAYREYIFIGTKARDPIKLRTFQLIVMVFDSRTQLVKIYVDGKRIIDTARSQAARLADRSESSLLIGSEVPSHSTWQGVIDDLAIWSRPLVDSEVLELWNEGKGRSVGELIDPADDDNDGILDAWEVRNGLDPTLDDRSEVAGEAEPKVASF